MYLKPLIKTNDELVYDLDYVILSAQKETKILNLELGMLFDPNHISSNSSVEKNKMVEIIEYVHNKGLEFKLNVNVDIYENSVEFQTEVVNSLSDLVPSVENVNYNVSEVIAYLTSSCSNPDEYAGFLDKAVDIINQYNNLMFDNKCYFLNPPSVQINWIADKFGVFMDVEPFLLSKNKSILIQSQFNEKYNSSLDHDFLNNYGKNFPEDFCKK